MYSYWLDLDVEKTILDYEFTKYAVMNLNRIISANDLRVWMRT